MMILVIIICYFAGLLLIAHITGHKGGSNAAFFKGENKSPWYIVSFGMIGATISGRDFRIRTGHGSRNGHDVYADRIRILLRLYDRSTHIAASLLQAESDKYLRIPRYTHRRECLPYRLFLLPALPYAGNGSQTVSRLSDPAYARISGYAHPFLGDCRRLRDPRVDIYPQKRHQDNRMDGHPANILSDRSPAIHHLLHHTEAGYRL